MVVTWWLGKGEEGEEGTDKCEETVVMDKQAKKNAKSIVAMVTNAEW